MGKEGRGDSIVVGEHTTAARPFVFTDTASEVDLDSYLADFEDDSISDEQKREYLALLWSIMQHLVELGFSQENCEQILTEVMPSTSAINEDDMMNTFNRAVEVDAS